MLTGRFKNASFGPPPNLHKCILLVKVYRFGQCLGWIFFAMSISFLARLLARLEMRHIRVSGAGIPTNAYLTFKDATCSPPLTRVFH